MYKTTTLLVLVLGLISLKPTQSQISPSHTKSPGSEEMDSTTPIALHSTTIEPFAILVRLKTSAIINIADKTLGSDKQAVEPTGVQTAGLPLRLKETLKEAGVVSVSKLVPGTSLLTSVKQSLKLTLAPEMQQDAAAALVQKLKGLSHVASAELMQPSSLEESLDSLTGETLLDFMYHLGDLEQVGYCENTGCDLPIDGELGALGNIRWQEAINAFGYGDASPIVAVADSGIDYAHADLENQLWVNPDCIELGYTQDNWWECEEGFYGLNAYPSHALERFWGTCDPTSPLAQEYADAGYDYIPTCRRPRSSTGGESCTHYCNECGVEVDDLENDDDPCLPLDALSDFDIMDNSGHGSFVAGAIAADANNGLGMPGACPKCEIMSLKYTTNSSNLTVAGIDYALSNGAKIINMSFGTKWFNFAPEHPIWAAHEQALNDGTLDSVFERTFDEDGNPVYSDFVQLLGSGYEDFIGAVHDAIDNDVLIFASAGNRGQHPGPVGSAKGDLDLYPYAPCMIPGVVCVANVDWNGEKAGSSSYGDAVDISAPGQLLLGARSTHNGMIDRCQPSENGDVNFDNQINVMDVVMMIQCVLEEINGCELPNGDLSGDGNINILDVIGLVEWVAAHQSSEEEEIENVSAPLLSSPINCKRFNENGEKDLTGDYGLASGTSFSTPVAAGVAGLILSHFPCLNSTQVKDLLLGTANPDFYNLNTEFENKLGPGIVDAQAALTQAYELYAGSCGE